MVNRHGDDATPTAASYAPSDGNVDVDVNHHHHSRCDSSLHCLLISKSCTKYTEKLFLKLLKVIRDIQFALDAI